MPILVNSPHSGKQVKVRDEDLKRALRDEDGRVFFVLERSDGQGYYTSPKRQGGEKDEQRYLKLQQEMVQRETKVRQNLAAVHDATGSKRKSMRGKLVILLLMVIGLAVAYAGWHYRDQWQQPPKPKSTSVSVSSSKSTLTLPAKAVHGAVTTADQSNHQPRK